MTLPTNGDGFSLHSFTSEEDIMTKELLLAHDPDGRQIDSRLLLRAAEIVLNHALASSEVFDYDIGSTVKKIHTIEEIESDEPLEQIVSKVSNKLVCKCSRESDLRTRIKDLFDLIGNYRWDAKVVLMLAGFALNYARFSLIMQNYSQNYFAASIAALKKLPRDLTKLKPRFKEMNSLIRVMVDVIKCIIRFECLPFRHVKLDEEAMIATKSYIYAATYWIIRSSLACSSQISDMIALNPEQITSAVAAWELQTLAVKLSRILSPLQRHVDWCNQQLGIKMHQKLLEILQETHSDNQKILDILLASKDDLPLKKAQTNARIDVTELKENVVLLLITKPEPLPLEELSLLVHQAHNHSHRFNLDGSYAIVWIPISSSDTWTDSEEESFNFLSDTLPWYSVKRPWEINEAVLDFIKQEWRFKADPVMVVIDQHGTVTNKNAIDMVLTWGPRAYPFSSSKEKELWEMQNLTLQLLVDEIDPLLTFWVEEGKQICLYASDNLQTVTELNAIFREIKRSGMKLELIYIGNSNLNNQVKSILSTIDQELHNNPLPFTKLHSFWRRLKSVRNSLQWNQHWKNTRFLLNQVTELLNPEDGRGWIILGTGVGSDIAMFSIKEGVEIMKKFDKWGQYVTNLGFSGAIKMIEVKGPCNHTKIVRFSEDLIKGNVFCEKCNRPVKPFVVFE